MPDEVNSRIVPSPTICELARRLLAYEALTAQTPALMPVFERLRTPLTALLGIASYRALLGRALALAKEHEPPLSSVYIEPYGALAGFKGDQGDGPGVVLVTQLLGLLELFIGSALTTNLVQNAWPAQPVPETKLVEKLEHDLRK